MILPLFGVIIGITGLVLSAERMVHGAAALAKIWRVPSWIVGLTIVAFGTSLPEFVVDVSSAIAGHDDIAIGTIVGSNVMNVLFIISVLACIFPPVLNLQRGWVEIGFMMVIASTAALLMWQSNDLSRIDGLVLLTLFVMYSVYLLSQKRIDAESTESHQLKAWKAGAWVVVSAIGLMVCGQLTTSQAVQLAEVAGVSQALISLTIVALGTSLPELVTSAVAAIRKEAALSLGNIIGSFTLNIVIVLGVTSIIQPLQYSRDFDQDLYFMLASIPLLTLAITLFRYKFGRWSALPLMLGCVTYFYLLFRLHLS